MIRPFKETKVFRAARHGKSISLIQQAIAILRRYGTDAHVYLPGIGTLSALQAGNYLDSAGTTAGTVDNPVGLVLDAAGSVGAELVTNGDFSSGTAGWTTTNSVSLAVASGLLTGTNTLAAYGRVLSPAFSVVAGSSYEVSFTCAAGSQRAISNCSFHNGAVAASAVGLGASIGSTVRQILVATVSGVTNLRLENASLAMSDSFTIDNINVKEVTGIHGTQPTTAAKPRLERGARNLLTWSSDFSNAAWSKGGAVLPVITAGATDPFGGTSAYEFDLTPAGDCRVSNTPSGVFNNSGVTEGVWLKAKTAGGTVSLGVRDGAGVLSYSTVTITTEWVLYAATFTGAAGAFSALTYVGNRNNGGTCNNFYVYRAGLFQGTLTAQQILDNGGIPLTTTAAASNPNAGRYSWAFDGGDSLSLGSVPFQMSDDHWVVGAGVVTNNTIPAQSFLSCANSGLASPIVGQISFLASGVQAAMRDDAGTLITATAASVAVGEVFVASLKRTTGSLVARKNGVAGTSASTTALGTTTLNTATIGASIRTGTANSLTGSTGPIAFGKGTISDADLLTLERLVSSLTPNGPVF